MSDNPRFLLFKKSWLADTTWLSCSSNRFQHVLTDEALDGAESAFRGVDELALGGTLLSWEELLHIAGKFQSLTTLSMGTNQLSSLPLIDYGNLSATLTSVNLEFNDFTSLAELGSLTGLKVLRNLHLKGNSISKVGEMDSTAPVFSSTLQYLDLSYNRVESWSFIDQLPTHFPGLTGLRISHNPVYDLQAADGNAPSSEESYMFTIARISELKSLNFAHINNADRTNAEMFYLSRIAKQLATVPAAAAHTTLAEHPRYAELCDIYGEPDVIRRQEINPSFLEARLITSEFHYGESGSKTARIPKSFDIYAVKSIVGKLFSLPPLQLRLVWETGEWDPVAGSDERDGESEDEDDEIPMEVQGEGTLENVDFKEKTGRWIKREVELTDGPKQLGYCVDGLNIKIRVETVNQSS